MKIVDERNLVRKDFLGGFYRAFLSHLKDCILAEKFRGYEESIFLLQNFRGSFFQPCGYRNFAKMMSNINVHSNIIGVKPIHPKTYKVCKTLKRQTTVFCRDHKSDL